MDVAEYAWIKTGKRSTEHALNYLIRDEEGMYNHPFVQGEEGCFLCQDT